MINIYMSEKTISDLDIAIQKLGDSINDIVTKAITVKDVRITKTTSLEFFSDPEHQIYGKGLLWKGMGNTKQFVYRANPDRVFLSEILDLTQTAYYSIGNVAVLRENELGPTVVKSNLTSVGTLKNLRTQGDLNVNDFVFFNSTHDRLGIGTENPNGMFSCKSLDAEFIIEPTGDNVKIGTYTTDAIAFITDDTERLVISSTGHVLIGSKGSNDSKVNIYGRLGIGINNVENDVSLSTAGPVRFEGKKHSVDSKPPLSGVYSKGDIVWNNDPKPTGYVGWICIRTGTPGDWKPFGQISQ